MNKLYGNCRQAGRQANKHAKWDTIDNYSPPPWLKEPVGCSERLTPYPVDLLHLRRCDEDEDDDGSTHHFYLSGGESIGTKSKRAKVEATDGEEKLRLFTSRARHKMSKARVATLFITLSLWLSARLPAALSMRITTNCSARFEAGFKASRTILSMRTGERKRERERRWRYCCCCYLPVTLINCRLFLYPINLNYFCKRLVTLITNLTIYFPESEYRGDLEKMWF